jgi:hypothetical protein
VPLIPKSAGARLPHQNIKKKKYYNLKSATNHCVIGIDIAGDICDVSMHYRYKRYPPIARR